MKSTIISFLKNLCSDRFKRNLLIMLIALGVILFIGNTESAEKYDADNVVFHFFHLDTCPHCREQKIFNERLKVKYPDAEFVYHEVSNSKEARLMRKMAYEAGASANAVPLTIFCGTSFTGYDSDETTGAEIDRALSECIEGKNAASAVKEKSDKVDDKVNIPIIGEINAAEYSLPALAVILGLVDGFNPCAMWVLVYLIGIALALRDKRKIWLLVGSFVLASGILYFLFMTAWLNAFLLLGYMMPITIIVGLVALGGGIISIRDYIKSKGAMVCEVTDAESRKETTGRLQRIMHSPITWATVAGMIGLAFVVNSIEFVCSAAIPAVFTHVLSLSSLAAWKYYFYILIYDIFFMLDDLIIFGFAAFAISSKYCDRYAKYCKIIGGILMLIIGIVLLFFPGLLR